ncbi:hypothetical protein QEH52_10660 [Coraliomargarita sp. SDUM461003]|uniref:PA14 domain-containing protein n=1 Tax=Thalassobacterium maritimum TaxID=3041265 RepID=A0ABU1AV00_9BACT|nr:hypothetical protein [Coraliomargarita sp. SDUM461003]MDQ8207973.1 hypothetical protein [Coraliomargarita sp. SDUM461003]
MIGLIQKFPLQAALLISLLLAAAASLALYFNDDWRQTTFAILEVEVDEEGEIVRKVKVERPEPNREQVREIARNKELKKREELKENARKLRKTVLSLEEVVEARKESLSTPDIWDELAAQSSHLMQQADEMRYWQTKSRFLTQQEGVAKSLIQLRNLADTHSKQMRVLALQIEVENDSAWAALEQAREVVVQITPAQASIVSAYESGVALPADREQEKIVRFMTERVEAMKQFAEEAKAYLAEFESFLMPARALPPIPTEDTPAETLTETSVDTLPEVEPELPASESDSAEREAVPSEADLDRMETDELYETIQAMTERLDEAFAENKAAELAEFKQIPLDQAKEQVYAPKTDPGPDLAESLKQNQPNSSEEFQAFNEALNQAVQSSERIARQAENRLSSASGAQSSDDKASQTADQLKQALSKAASLKAKMAMAGSNMGRSNGNLQDLRSLMQQSYANASLSGGDDDTGQAGLSASYDSESFLGADKSQNNPSGIRLDSRKTFAQALPGRRFDQESSRKGWIFVDTWYIIGPWDLPKGPEFEQSFPPETMVDLDASYEGKRHPRTKEAMQLRWRFVQSGSLRIKPPDELSSTVYFAYTEVFCESAMDVVVAVASDDRAKLWINDLVVFQDVGLSGWQLDEGFRRVLLKPGYNSFLLRLENGPAVANFSVLMCPADAVLGQ